MNPEFNVESSYDIFDSAIHHALKHYYNNSEYEDLYQECYLKILDVLKNKTYEPILNLYGYAYKIARNTISTYMYHKEKVTTLVNEEFPEIPENVDFDFNMEFDEILDKILNKYKNSLPKDFTKDDLLKMLLEGTGQPKSSIFTIIRGDLIWAISDNMKDY